MVDRLVILAAAACIVVIAWVALKLWRRGLIYRLRLDSPLRDIAPTGQPGVIAFTAPHCQECHTRQAPALERLRSVLGNQVTVNTVSALDHPELVQQLGILTVPATAVVDAAGTVRYLNLGYTSDVTLREQLSGLTRILTPVRTSPQTLPAR